MIYSNFSYPNDVHIEWTLMIVTYPFITGLVAGAFVASALYHVFGRDELEPVNRFALLLSLAFMTCATLPLLNHLGHPERNMNVIITPHFRSAIALFSMVYSFYLTLLTVEIWLSYRLDMIEYYRNSTGVKKMFWGVLTLGVNKITPKAVKFDAKLIHILSVVGIPGAFCLHGYVGFLFGSLKSNPWWSTPLMPQIFLLSAVQSGIALLILLYLYLGRRGSLEKSFKCLKSLALFLWFAIILTSGAEGLEFLSMIYEDTETWWVISNLISTKLFFSLGILQLGVGVLIPLTILTWVLFAPVSISERAFTWSVCIAAALALFEVWMMRWNVVIGGQLFSKSFVGFREYAPQLFEKEGIAAAIGLTLLPLLVLYIISRFVSLRTLPHDHAEKMLERETQDN